LAPAADAGLRVFEEAAVLLTLQPRVKYPQRSSGIADQTGLDRIAQADALRITVDLNAARLSRLRVILDIGEGRTDDQQGVAFLHRLLRGQGAKDADAAGGMGMIVR